MAACPPTLKTIEELIQAYSDSHAEHLSKYSYWKDRYLRPSENLGFDWFLDSEEILEFVMSSFEEFSRDMCHPVSVLDLGCGTSSLPRKILARSQTPLSLVLLDFVHEALQYQKQQMSLSSARRTESLYQLVCADVMSLPFFDDSFHVAVDKGTMDALLKDKDKGHHNAEVMMSEVWRVLTLGGRFVLISDEDPDSRLLFLDKLGMTSQDTQISASLSSEAADKQCSATTLQQIYGCNSMKNSTPPYGGKLYSSWSFKVITSRWGQEYFMYWAQR